MSTISFYANAPTFVRHAINRLADYTGFDVGGAPEAAPDLCVAINDRDNTRIGVQGYSIRSSDTCIEIAGNTDEGVANGIFTCLRILMIEHRKDPTTRPWDIEEQPQFAVRAMQIAAYRFGASYGFAALSPDRWTFEEWREYIDLMRLANMTTLVLASHRAYHPDYPQSERERWRFEVWKRVMDYCHQVGIKFNWYINPNLVTPQAYWENPDLRADQEDGAWHSSGLRWTTGKELILKNQEYAFNLYRGMDGLEVIFSDGGGLSFDEETGADPTAYFADAVNSYIELLRKTGNDAQFVFWNWVLYFWSSVMIPEQVLEKFPKYRTMQDDIIPLLPKSVAWLDASVLTMIQNQEFRIRSRGNPPMREGLLIGKEHGFAPVIDFFWYMNPEYSINMLPHPFIKRGIQEARYARDEIGADGVEGYRLAPPCRFIGDYVFFRVASDPSLSEEQLIDEVAGLLGGRQEDVDQLKEAITLLERFWTSHALADIEQADSLFRASLSGNCSPHLEYVSNGVTFLLYVVRLAQAGLTAGQKAQLRNELFQTVQPMYIFQGVTSDVVWLPEARRFFDARVDMMVEDYRNFMWKPELVDRKIYPKATSDSFQLQWQE